LIRSWLLALAITDEILEIKRHWDDKEKVLMWVDNAVDAQKLLDKIKKLLPQSVDILAYGERSMIPAKVQSYRQTLIHRAEDLATSAIFLANSGNKVPSVIISRAIIETAAALFLLNQKVCHFMIDQIDVDRLDSYLMRSLYGSKADDAKYTVFNIQRAVDALRKVHPDIADLYDKCSEIVHPGWQGVQGSYASFDDSGHQLKLGKHYSTLSEDNIWQPIIAGLTLFMDCYLEPSDSLNALVDKLNR
jgi:hypothetical protein